MYDVVLYVPKFVSRNTTTVKELCIMQYVCVVFDTQKIRESDRLLVLSTGVLVSFQEKCVGCT